MSIIVTGSMNDNTDNAVNPAVGHTAQSVISLSNWRTTDPAALVLRSLGGGTTDFPTSACWVFQAPTPGLYWLQSRLTLLQRYASRGGGASIALVSQADTSGAVGVALAQTRSLLEEVASSTPVVNNDPQAGRVFAIEASCLASLAAGQLVYVIYSTNCRVTCPQNELNRFSAMLVHGGELPSWSPPPAAVVV